MVNLFTKILWLLIILQSLIFQVIWTFLLKLRAQTLGRKLYIANLTENNLNISYNKYSTSTYNRQTHALGSKGANGAWRR